MKENMKDELIEVLDSSQEQEREDKRVVTTKKNNRKKRLFSLILLLLVTGVILSTSTYAWFTSNKMVKVNTITVNVDAKGGIQLSTDGTNWKSIIATADITGVHATTYEDSINQLPATLEPVSTGGNVDENGLMEMYLGTVVTDAGGDFILTTAKSTETESNGATSTGKFVAFDLFFRSDSATNLYLTTNSTIVTTDETDTGIKNAARIAFVKLGNTAIGSTTETIQALNAGVDSDVYIWEPNYDVHTAAAVANANDTYSITTTQTGGSALAWNGVVDEIAAAADVKLGEATATDHATLFKAMSPTYATVSGFSAYTQVFGLSAGITKVRVYMWVEGQDVDCENGASGGSVSFNMQFSTDSSAGA